MKYLFLITMLCSTVTVLYSQQSYYLITGTYTSGKSKGIYVHRFDPQEGRATEVSVTTSSNPSYLCASADGQFVYAVHENGGDGKGGEISAYSFDRETGQLKLLNTLPTGGDHPCYVATDNTGKFVVAGNYSGGNLSIYSIMDDGSLEKADFIQHSGSSVNKDRQEKPHVHSTVISPNGQKILVGDLGIDRIMIYKRDPFTLKLSPAPQPSVAVDPGAGPRHLVFDPKGKFAYLVTELNGEVVAYQWKKDRLKKIQSISTLAPGESGFTGSSDIRISPDGKYLYAGNRAEFNNIAIYHIHPKKGTLQLTGHQTTLGKTPRHFNFDPTGQFLLVGNQNSDEVVVFRYNADTGLLSDTGNRIEIGKPVCFAWIGTK